MYVVARLEGQPEITLKGEGVRKEESSRWKNPREKSRSRSRAGGKQAKQATLEQQQQRPTYRPTRVTRLTIKKS